MLHNMTRAQQWANIPDAVLVQWASISDCPRDSLVQWPTSASDEEMEAQVTVLAQWRRQGLDSLESVALSQAQDATCPTSQASKSLRHCCQREGQPD
jgi:hypothetical protein